MVKGGRRYESRYLGRIEFEWTICREYLDWLLRTTCVMYHECIPIKNGNIIHIWIWHNALIHLHTHRLIGLFGFRSTVCLSIYLTTRQPKSMPEKSGKWKTGNGIKSSVLCMPFCRISFCSMRFLCLYPHTHIHTYVYEHINVSLSHFEYSCCTLIYLGVSLLQSVEFLNYKYVNPVKPSSGFWNCKCFGYKLKITSRWK